MKSIFVTALVAIAAAVFTVDSATAQNNTPLSTPVSHLTYGATGVTDSSGKELHVAPAYGELTNDPHGSFGRMLAGFSGIPHANTGNYWGAVVSGVAANGKAGSAELLPPVGSL